MIRLRYKRRIWRLPALLAVVAVYVIGTPPGVGPETACCSMSGRTMREATDGLVFANVRKIAANVYVRTALRTPHTYGRMDHVGIPDTDLDANAGYAAAMMSVHGFAGTPLALARAESDVSGRGSPLLDAFRSRSSSTNSNTVLLL